jgi:hypothetical protein
VLIFPAQYLITSLILLVLLFKNTLYKKHFLAQAKLSPLVSQYSLSDYRTISMSLGGNSLFPMFALVIASSRNNEKIPALLSKDWDLSGFNGIACARSWRWNRTRRARPLVHIAAAILALLSHERKCLRHTLYFPCSSCSSPKRLNEKIPADVSQQGFIWI